MKKLFIVALALIFNNTWAIPKYDEGRIQIKGVQLLQDHEDPNAYYYLPQFPRLSSKEDGTFEFMCIKYVGAKATEANGGLFHALVEFTLPEEILKSVEAELKNLFPAAKIAGPVPLMQAMKEGENGMAAFKVISSILKAGGDKPEGNMVTSGHAPLLPGSKAAIAARLNQQEATLLWESFQGGTSDVSVSITGYYEAVVKSYNATISADLNTIYEHYSRLQNDQEGFNRTQLRRIADQLQQQQAIKIDVFDRSAGLGIKTDDVQKIVDIITDKLIELMFDAKEGWSKQPDREVAVEQGQIQGRQERGWFDSVFGGAKDTPYYTDHQYVMKKRSDVRSFSFYMNLSKSTTIKVPIFSTGNLRGMFETFNKNAENPYFRIVSLNDAAFERRDLHFQIDGNFIESFKEILNSVSVSVKKTYPNNQPEFSADLIYRRDEVEKGGDIQTVKYPLLGVKDKWEDYEYRVKWNFKGIAPKEELDVWEPSQTSVVLLSPPFNKKVIELYAERSAFKDSTVHTAVVKFMSVLGGKANIQKTSMLRLNDTSPTTKISLYHDKPKADEKLLAYQITWYGANGKSHTTPVKAIDEDLLYILPPNKGSLK